MRFAKKSTIESFTLLDLTLTFFDPQPPRFFLHDPTETKKNSALAPKPDPKLGFFSQPYSKNSDQKLLQTSTDLVFVQINSTRQQNLFLFRNESAFASNKPSLHSLSRRASFLPSCQSINGPKDTSFTHWFLREHDRNIHRSNQIKPWLRFSFLLRFGQPIKGPKDTSSNHWFSVSITQIP